MQLVERLGAKLFHYRLAFALIVTLLLFIAVTLPFTVASLVDDALSPPEGQVHRLVDTPSPPESMHARVHLALVGFDELSRLASFHLSGQHVCPGTACPARLRIIFFSLGNDTSFREIWKWPANLRYDRLFKAVE